MIAHCTPILSTTIRCPMLGDMASIRHTNRDECYQVSYASPIPIEGLRTLPSSYLLLWLLAILQAWLKNRYPGQASANPPVPYSTFTSGRRRILTHLNDDYACPAPNSNDLSSSPAPPRHSLPYLPSSHQSYNHSLCHLPSHLTPPLLHYL